ncbi:hypothetical protein [Amantichitinum ursilacus]|uniref:Uncharacterized protein n=1 Tax=Amantichitinum ursilacus TaxID=857265 RepID=A0A0N0GQS1_9NEIS|nr:hypothetical protein [Amantichitinum ursilacus]KPC54711.1 hypothetical protein WG78_04030 [Amantichitinum ursilacus]
MQAYVEFLGHLPQFQYDPARQLATHLLTGATIACVDGSDEHHRLCVHFPGASQADCEVDGAKLTLLYIHEASSMGIASAAEYSATLVNMLLKAKGSGAAST